MTTDTPTPTQRARQERLERETAQLRAEGVPDDLIRAYGDPDLARAAWAKVRLEEEQDPLARKQRRESEKVRHEMEARLEAVREEHRERQRAVQPIDLGQIEAAAADAERRLPELVDQLSRVAPEALVDDRAAAEAQDVGTAARQRRSSLSGRRAGTRRPRDPGRG